MKTKTFYKQGNWTGAYEEGQRLVKSFKRNPVRDWIMTTVKYNVRSNTTKFVLTPDPKYIY